MSKRTLIRVGLIAAGVIALFSVLLALDLANRGLAWRVMWSLTGEETPLGQAQGMIEWAGNITRAQPRTDPYAAIQHVGMNPYGVNTFLEQEVELERRERQVALIAEAGIGWMRQQFPWEDIEIHARGDFVDRRNDPDGVDAWAKYDHIVGLAEQYGVRLQVRLDNPPSWSRANPDEGSLAPPDDWEDYYTFIRAVAERYRGRVTHYQIWNEPNIYPEWGNNPVDPEAYTAVLCRAYAELKALDPEIVVIAGALSPTVAITERDLSDLIFLQRMYDAGARGCFDVMSMQGYGFYSGPTDQRMRTTTLNSGRNLYIRDIMVANGDSSTPIWISEAAWNPVDAPEVPADLVGRENFGSVTPEQAAAYMPLLYERAEREWSWVGVINIWFFKRATDLERDQPFYYFRMVDPDFTLRPLYHAIQDHTANHVPTLHRGTHSADHRAITFSDDATSAAFRAHGTHVLIRWQASAGDAITVTAGGDSFTLTADDDAPRTDEIASALIAIPHDVTITGDPFTLDTVIVYDRTGQNLTPIIAGGVLIEIMIIAGLIGVFRARRANRPRAPR